jgi:hypothetical protein
MPSGSEATRAAGAPRRKVVKRPSIPLGAGSGSRHTAGAGNGRRARTSAGWGVIFAAFRTMMRLEGACLQGAEAPASRWVHDMVRIVRDDDAARLRLRRSAF